VCDLIRPIANDQLAVTRFSRAGVCAFAFNARIVEWKHRVNCIRVEAKKQQRSHDASNCVYKISGIYGWK
jgi:hypothetical protein